MTDQQKTQATGAAPWWKESMVWLVWGGPLVVVVASFVTLFIAVKFGDPPLTSSELAKTAPGRNTAMTPAVQARNHVVTQQEAPSANR